MAPLNESKHGNYAFLLSGLLILFLLIPILHTYAALTGDLWLMRIGLLGSYSVLMLLGVWSLHKETLLFRIGWLLALFSVIFSISNWFFDKIIIQLAANVVVLMFSTISALIAAKHVFGSNRVDRNLLFGALTVYLLLGLIWTILYSLIVQLDPAAFQGSLDLTNNKKSTMDDLLYYSFVTLTGLGYGDITPAIPIARSLAYLEAVAGQMYIAVLVAGLVGKYMKDTGTQ